MATSRIANLDQKTKDELAELAMELGMNSKTRKQFGRLLKESGSSVRLADVEAEDAATSAVNEAVTRALKDKEIEDAAAAIKTRLGTQRASLLRTDSNPDGRYDDAQMGKLEQFMQERGISDYEDGAVLYSHAHPEPHPTPEIASHGQWTLPTGDWVKDPKGTARKMATQAVADILSARR